MPKSLADLNYRPVHRPFFVSDGNGGLRLDSAGSQANFALESMLLEKKRPVPVPEHIEHVQRQKGLNKFLLNSAGGEPQFHRPRPGVAFPLPRLASPQRLHTNFYETTPQSQIDEGRKNQIAELKGTLVGSVLQKTAYKAIDEALKESHERKAHLISLKKDKQNLFSKASNKQVKFSRQDVNWIYEPLYLRVESQNSAMKNLGGPLQFVFRKTWETETQQEVDIWVIYANDTGSAAKGPDSWMGSRDIVDPKTNQYT